MADPENFLLETFVLLLLSVSLSEESIISVTPLCVLFATLFHLNMRIIYVINKGDKPDLHGCFEKAAKYCFGSETGKPGDYHQNRESPSKAGRVNRYVFVFGDNFRNDKCYILFVFFY